MKNKVISHLLMFTIVVSAVGAVFLGARASTIQTKQVVQVVAHVATVKQDTTSLLKQSGSSASATSASTPRVLVFNGIGTSPTDTSLLVQLLAAHGFTYRLVNSAQVAAMSLNELASYRLILWPGGDSMTMTRNLSAATRENIREAVVTRGVNYVGFCAGAFMAVGLSTPTQGGWGLGIVPGKYLGLYTPAGIAHPSYATAATVNLRFPDGSHNEMYWQDGPALPTWSHGSISTYPNGQTAMGQMWSGKGFVVLSGVHPEATEGWFRAQHLTDSDGLDAAVAWNLIQAAVTQRPLPTF